jgi:hypothetical protein
MITPPTVATVFKAKNGNVYSIDSIFPPLTDEDGGVFRIMSKAYNAVLNTGNQVVTNIRQRTDGTWEEVKTDIPGANYPMASN